MEVGEGEGEELGRERIREKRIREGGVERGVKRVKRGGNTSSNFIVKTR